MIPSNGASGQKNRMANRNHPQRRYALKAGSVFKLIGLVAALVLATITGTTQAQPVFPYASGCKEAAILTTEQWFNPGTGAFTIDRTIVPGEDTEVVLGAWVVIDSPPGFPGDPTAGALGTPNCTGSPVDGNPTYVTKLVLWPASGSWENVGVKELTIWLDNDVDGFITPGKDTQLNTFLDPTCLDSDEGCVVTFGNQPLVRGALAVSAGLDDNGLPIAGVHAGCAPHPGVGGASCAGIILVAELENPKPGATLQVRVEAFASDLVNQLPGFQFSSDFAPQYKKSTSSIRVVVQGVPGAPGVLSPAVNNASGNPETGVLGIDVVGIRTRDDRGGLAGTLERDARPGDREFFVGIVALCESGDLVTPQVTLLPPIAGATPTIAGGLGAIPCVPSTAAPDANPTNVVRIRIGVSGPGAQYVQAVHVYADDGVVDPNGVLNGWAAPVGAGFAAQLFEPGELIGNAIPINGVAVFGSLEQTLRTSGGMPLVVAPGPVPGGGPALLYFTADIDDRAQPSEVVFQVAIDVADVPGGDPVFASPSSRLLRTVPQEFRFQISGPAAPPAPGGVAQFDTNGNNVIDDAEFFNAIDQWVAGTITDTLFFAVLDHWVAQTPIATSGLSGQAAVSLALAQSAQGLTLSAGGPNVAAIGLRVYDLNGRTVFSREAAGTTLSWNYLSSEGTPVANGVYLYVVEVKDAQGRVLTSEVKKLVVVR